MAFKSGVGLFSEACLIMDRFRSFEFDGLKALIGLANAHVQVLLRPPLISGPAVAAVGVGFLLSSSAEDETKYDEEEEDEEDEVIMNPLNKPPHFTLSLIQWWSTPAPLRWLEFPPAATFDDLLSL